MEEIIVETLAGTIVETSIEAMAEALISPTGITILAIEAIIQAVFLAG
jgi:hypothetical protein